MHREANLAERPVRRERAGRFRIPRDPLALILDRFRISGSEVEKMCAFTKEKKKKEKRFFSLFQPILHIIPLIALLIFQF